MTTSASRYVIIGLVIAVVLVTIVSGFIILGSPAEERLLRIDIRRVNDLMRISNDVDVYWTRQKRLPVTLEELAGQPWTNRSFRDPATAQFYEYRALQDSTYELCATFQRDSSRESPGQVVGFWSHGAGRQCFTLVARDVSPSSYDYKGTSTRGIR